MTRTHLAGVETAVELVGGARVPITAVVLTLNEELNLAECLASLVGWVEEIVVVDSGSTDSTLNLAARAGARVAHHAFESHSAQWSWALENLQINTDWVLGLDADQQVTPELRSELLSRFGPQGDRGEGINGFYIARRQIFRGRWIRHGGYYPKYLLKLFRRDRVRFDSLDLSDHHFYVDGRTERLDGDIAEDNRKEYDIGFWVEKHTRYAARIAREELLRRKEGGGWPLPPSLWGSPDQRVMWMKDRWYRMPLYLRPLLYFFYRYVLRLGFLDGKQGFIFHFLQGYWFRLLVDVHLDDLLEPPPHRSEKESR